MLPIPWKILTIGCLDFAEGYCTLITTEGFHLVLKNFVKSVAFIVLASDVLGMSDASNRSSE